jgi:hypothetical protein
MNDTKLDRVFGRNYKILKLYLVEPEREFYVTEAAEILNMNKMSILRALEGMVKARLMKSRFDNYRKFYKLRDSPMIKLLKILGNLDSLLVSEFLKKFESKSELIMLFGSRADGTGCCSRKQNHIRNGGTVRGADKREAVHQCGIHGINRKKDAVLSGSDD